MTIIHLSPETYQLLKRRAREVDATPDQLAEAAIRLQFGNTTHIEQRDSLAGPQAMIRGTRVAVHHVAAFLKAGLSVEEIITEALPDLSPAAIYEAAAYYHDHPAEIEAQWEANAAETVLNAFRERLDPDQLARLMGRPG